MTILCEAIRLAELVVTAIEDESDALARGAKGDDYRQIVDAKARLVNEFEREIATLKKRDSGTLEAAGEAKVEQLKGLLERVSQMAGETAQVVERRARLTEDLLSTVVEDARRLNGASIMRYGAAGNSRPGHRAAAVSVDASL